MPLPIHLARKVWWITPHLVSAILKPSYYYLLDKTDTRVKIPRSLKPSYNPNITDRIYMPHRKGMVREKNEFYLRPGKSLIGARKNKF